MESTWTAKFKISPRNKIILLALIIGTLLVLRRPYQFLYPAVWVEDGTVLIPEGLEYGFRAIFRPINGYLVFVPRIINLLSLQFPLEYYPEVSTFLGASFNIFVFFCVVYSPTILKWKTLCAIAVFLIPVNSEVYVLPSYTFWLASVLLILALLWDPSTEKGNRLISSLRAFFLILGGLSSPLRSSFCIFRCYFAIGLPFITGSRGDRF